MNKATTATLASLYVMASGVAAAGLDRATDLDVFFLPSTAFALAGHPLSIYAMRTVTNVATYADANGPLSLVPLTVVAWILARVGLLGQLRWQHVIVTAVFSVCTLWMAREAMHAIDRCRAVPFRRVWRLFALAIVAASPVLWVSEIGYGHIEQPIAIGFTLLAVSALAADRPGLAGFALGLTGLTRTLTLVFAIPLAIVLWKRRGLIATLRMGAMALLTMALGLLPFLLAHPADVIFSMVKQHADLPIGIGSIWYLLQGTSLAALGRHADTLLIAIAAVISTLALLRIRRDLSFDDVDVYGLLAIAGIWVSVLIKIEWPYYLIEPFIFASIWWLARVRRPALGWLVPAFLTGATLIAEFATHREQTVLGGLATITLVVMLLAFVVFAGWAIARPGPQENASDRLAVEPEFVRARI